jgi:hypothetical protein
VTDAEEEFLRRVADPDLIEARARLRELRRAQKAGLTIVTLSVAILLLGITMRHSAFGRGVGFLGIVTGVLGVVAVIGPLISAVFHPTIIVVSLLTTLWILLVGYRLIRGSLAS